MPQSTTFTSAPTITLVTIMSTTLSAPPPPTHTHPSLLFIQHLIWPRLILLLGLPLIWFLARLHTSQIAHQKRTEHKKHRAWEKPWLTKDWETLYGLMWLSNRRQWNFTPFWLGKNVQRHWHLQNRPWLSQLLGMGVIPLFIQDGGMDMHRVNYTGFRFITRFPYLKTPIYQQGKRRAYFEFLVPFPYGSAKRAALLESVVNNRADEEMGNERFREDFKYGVTMRFGPPDYGRIFVAEDNSPALKNQPLEVGAQCMFKPLLPLKPDGVLKSSYGKHANTLAFFMRNNDPGKVPLLQNAETVLVRVEAQHYGPCELDAFVFGLAQKAGLEIEWPERRCRKAALRELRRCGLPTEGLNLGQQVRDR
jgi:hypothetical protein